MRLVTILKSACALIGLAACDTRTGQTASSSAGATPAPASGKSMPSALTPAQLALFAPLPTQMTSPANPITLAKVALGRRLYHEPVLSGGHDVSCATCHALNGYGADGRRVSFGDIGHAGSRNAPSVYNAAGQVAQFWDGRAPTVEEQAKGPVLNPLEMAMPNPGAVLDHFRGSPDYRAAFRAAFPAEREPINYDNMGRAIGAFERGLVTPARWDKFLRGDSAALTPDERGGLVTFVSVGCVGCHMGTYVGGASFQKIGLVKPWPSQADSGRFKVTKRPQDMMVFKVPSLRNVAQTGPYFHDGSVNELSEAVRLMARHQLGRELDSAQIRSIVSWLGSLTGDIPGSYIAFPQLPATRR